MTKIGRLIPVFIILAIMFMIMIIDFVRGAIFGYKQGKLGYKVAKDKSKVMAAKMNKWWEEKKNERNL